MRWGEVGEVPDEGVAGEVVLAPLHLTEGEVGPALQEVLAHLGMEAILGGQGGACLPIARELVQQLDGRFFERL